ncbi:hypothetical protein K438DRAFT_1926776 [Mycena galopus ATCC 62051]|nr:hypothetical protein K438DRAFT_1926776 [Mycena galopus ATCC 62051]
MSGILSLRRDVHGETALARCANVEEPSASELDSPYVEPHPESFDLLQQRPLQASDHQADATAKPQAPNPARSDHLDRVLGRWQTRSLTPSGTSCVSLSMSGVDTVPVPSISEPWKTRRANCVMKLQQIFRQDSGVIVVGSGGAERCLPGVIKIRRRSKRRCNDYGQRRQSQRERERRTEAEVTRNVRSSDSSHRHEGDLIFVRVESTAATASTAGT